MSSPSFSYLVLLLVCVHHAFALSVNYANDETQDQDSDETALTSSNQQCHELRQELHELKQSLFPTDLIGWIVFQRRMDGTVDFYRNWNQYRIGFGDPKGEFWLGLNEISRLMKLGSYELRVDMQDFDGNWRYAYYRNFHVGEYYDSFPITTSGYVGDAGNGMSFDDVPFSTKDHDHDASEGDCAETFEGAWWYIKCHASNLNGRYLWGPHESYANGVNWAGFRGNYYSLKYTEMKMRLRPSKP